MGYTYQQRAPRDFSDVTAVECVLFSHNVPVNREHVVILVLPPDILRALPLVAFTGYTI